MKIYSNQTRQQLPKNAQHPSRPTRSNAHHQCTATFHTGLQKRLTFNHQPDPRPHSLLSLSLLLPALGHLRLFLHIILHRRPHCATSTASLAQGASYKKLPPLTFLPTSLPILLCPIETLLDGGSNPGVPPLKLPRSILRPFQPSSSLSTLRHFSRSSASSLSARLDAN